MEKSETFVKEEKDALSKMDHVVERHILDAALRGCKEEYHQSFLEYFDKDNNKRPLDNYDNIDKHNKNKLFMSWTYVEGGVIEPYLIKEYTETGKYPTLQTWLGYSRKGFDSIKGGINNEINGKEGELREEHKNAMKQLTALFDIMISLTLVMDHVIERQMLENVLEGCKEEYRPSFLAYFDKDNNKRSLNYNYNIDKHKQIELFMSFITWIDVEGGVSRPYLRQSPTVRRDHPTYEAWFNYSREGFNRIKYGINWKIELCRDPVMREEHENAMDRLTTLFDIMESSLYGTDRVIEEQILQKVLWVMECNVTYEKQFLEYFDRDSNIELLNKKSKIDTHNKIEMFLSPLEWTATGKCFTIDSLRRAHDVAREYPTLEEWLHNARGVFDIIKEEINREIDGVTDPVMKEVHENAMDRLTTLFDIMKSYEYTMDHVVERQMIVAVLKECKEDCRQSFLAYFDTSKNKRILNNMDNTEKHNLIESFMDSIEWTDVEGDVSIPSLKEAYKDKLEHRTRRKWLNYSREGFDRIVEEITDQIDRVKDPVMKEEHEIAMKRFKILFVIMEPHGWAMDHVVEGQMIVAVLGGCDNENYRHSFLAYFDTNRNKAPLAHESNIEKHIEIESFIDKIVWTDMFGGVDIPALIEAHRVTYDRPMGQQWINYSRRGFNRIINGINGINNRIHNDPLEDRRREHEIAMRGLRALFTEVDDL